MRRCILYTLSFVFWFPSVLRICRTTQADGNMGKPKIMPAPKVAQ